jgi:ABC-type arginine/histidine transport system permease subunit
MPAPLRRKMTAGELNGVRSLPYACAIQTILLEFAAYESAVVRPESEHKAER